MPEEVRAHYDTLAPKGKEKEEAWEAVLAQYKEAHPTETAELLRRMAGDLPEDWLDVIPTYSLPVGT